MALHKTTVAVIALIAAHAIITKGRQLMWGGIGRKQGIRSAGAAPRVIAVFNRV